MATYRQQEEQHGQPEKPSLVGVTSVPLRDILTATHVMALLKQHGLLVAMSSEHGWYAFYTKPSDVQKAKALVNTDARKRGYSLGMRADRPEGAEGRQRWHERTFRLPATVLSEDRHGVPIALRAALRSGRLKSTLERYPVVLDVRWQRRRYLDGKWSLRDTTVKAHWHTGYDAQVTLAADASRGAETTTVAYQVLAGGKVYLATDDFPVLFGKH